MSVSPGFEVSSARFRAAREMDWARLEGMLDSIERGRTASLDDDELFELPVLYRSALSSLSVARETSLDADLVTYLEALCTRAYFILYGVHAPLAARLRAFLRRDWPAAVRSLWRETLAAFAITAIGVLVGYLLVGSDPSWFYSIVSEDYAQGRGPGATAAELRQVIEGKNGNFGFATWLFTHNAQIAIGCFALGFVFGLPTILLLLVNGTLLGAFLQIYVAKGLGADFAGWLAIHGTTEIFAIILAGGAGLRIGMATAFPGEHSRFASAVRAGRTAAFVMLGVVMMLAVAGLLEGIGRQAVQATSLRFAIGGGALGFWLLYFYLPRRPRPRPMASRAAADPRFERAFITPEGVDLKLVLASAGERAAAYVIDVIVILLTLIVLSIGAIMLSFATSGVTQEALGVIWMLGMFVLRNGYFLAFELGGRAATLGKRFIGLRVVARDGGRLTGEAVVARNALRELEIALPLTLLVYLMSSAESGDFTWVAVLIWVIVFLFFPIFNRDRLRVGDLIAGTWVVRTPRKSLGRSVVHTVEAPPQLVFTEAQLGAYGEYELKALEEVLRRRDEHAVIVVARTIRQRIGWTGGEGDDLEFLTAYYAALCARLERNMLFGKRRADKHHDAV